MEDLALSRQCTWLDTGNAHAVWACGSVGLWVCGSILSACDVGLCDRGLYGSVGLYCMSVGLCLCGSVWVCVGLSGSVICGSVWVCGSV